MSGKPSFAVDAFLKKGLAFHQQGRFEDAQACYAQVLQWQADNADAWHLLGVLLGALGQTGQGIEHLQRAIRLRPDFAAAHNNLGNVYRDCQQWDAAIMAYRCALAARPDYPAALNNLGCALKAQQQLPQAVASLRRAVELEPDYAEAYYNLGNAYVALGEFEAALTAYHAGLARRPDDAEMLLALGKCYERQGRAEQGLAVVEQVLALAPLCADAYNTLGALREQLGEIGAARDAYQQAVNLAPNQADAQLNLGMTELRLGSFSPGWRGYAYRPQESGMPNPLTFAARAVVPDELAGKFVLLHAEQGLGDTLQFARYALLLVDAGVTVGLVVPSPLKSLLAVSLPAVSVFSKGELLPAADEHCPLLSLPLVFGTKLETIPTPPPYVHAPQTAMSRWANRLPLASAVSQRVGVAWSGNPKHENDPNRSIPLVLFSTLMAGFDGQFFGLQTEIRASDRAIIPTLSNLLDLSGEIEDCADTASIMANLDLIITVDTSIAHLAGAMGKPVWVLVPFVPDWRWLLDREDSPWYPTMRLFRQSTQGEWLEVLRRVNEALLRY